MTLPITTHTLHVPGARLHYEVRGAGPVVLVIGSPMASAEFAPLADALATDHTVVTYDPRGIAASSTTPELRADDVAALLDAVGAESADVFGSSGGAVTGLALVAKHPGRGVQTPSPASGRCPQLAGKGEASRSARRSAA